MQTADNQSTDWIWGLYLDWCFTIITNQGVTLTLLARPFSPKKSACRRSIAMEKPSMFKISSAYINDLLSNK